MKRVVQLLCASLALAAAPFGASAQGSYPSQPVKWIVPYPAGGGTDNLARALAGAMQPSLGQPLVIDNRPGAATNIGVGVVMQAKPDGYTIMQAENAARCARSRSRCRSAPAPCRKCRPLRNSA